MFDHRISDLNLKLGLSQADTKHSLHLLVQFVFNSGEQSWCEAALALPTLTEQQFLSDAFDPADLMEMLKQELIHAIVEVDLPNLSRLEERLNQIKLSVPIREIILPVEEENEEDEVKSSSLRALFTSIAPEQEPEPPQIVPSELEFSPDQSFKFPLVALFIQSLKQTYGNSVAQTWAGADPEWVDTIEPTQPQIVSPVNGAKRRSVFEIGSHILFEPPTEQTEEVFGKQSQKLQAYLRELKKWILYQSEQAGIDSYPGILLLLNGAFSKLYTNNMGRQLGGIFGFSKATQPLTLQIIDPILAEDLSETLVQLKSLKKLVAGRKLDVRLGVEAQIDSLAAVDHCIEREHVDLVSLVPHKFEAFSDLIVSLNRLKRAEIGILLNLQQIKGDPLIETMLDIVDWYRPDMVFPPKRFINFCNSLIMNAVIEK